MTIITVDKTIDNTSLKNKFKPESTIYNAIEKSTYIVNIFSEEDLHGFALVKEDGDCGISAILLFDKADILVGKNLVNGIVDISRITKSKYIHVDIKDSDIGMFKKLGFVLDESSNTNDDLNRMTRRIKKVRFEI